MHSYSLTLVCIHQLLIVCLQAAIMNHLTKCLLFNFAIIFFTTTITIRGKVKLSQQVKKDTNSP